MSHRGAALTILKTTLVVGLSLSPHLTWVSSDRGGVLYFSALLLCYWELYT